MTMGMETDYLKQKWDAGLTYDAYVKSGKPEQFDNWQKVSDQIALTDDQNQLLQSFERDMHVLVISGIWCGDCVQQGPLIQRVAEGNTGKIRIRWVDRDEHLDLQEKVKINAGNRVPVAIFIAEDFEFVSWFGDRTITRYRALAARQLGASCPLPGAPIPTDELQATMQDWLDEFERVQLCLRTSTRLRQKHGD